MMGEKDGTEYLLSCRDNVLTKNFHVDSFNSINPCVKSVNMVSNGGVKSVNGCCQP